VGVISVHPFYGPSGRLLSGRDARMEGLLSMAAYLAFWGAALVVAKRELDRRWPPRPRPDADAVPAIEVLRSRFARGELEESQFRAMVDVLNEARGSTR
jgi:putative membrane protein